MVLLRTVPLRYSKSALKPVMSPATLDYHFEHLAKNYAKNYNAHKGDPKFNKAGNFLHNIFFAQFRKPRAHNEPTGEVLEFINKHFGSYDGFKVQNIQKHHSTQLSILYPVYHLYLYLYFPVY